MNVPSQHTSRLPYSRYLHVVFRLSLWMASVLAEPRVMIVGNNEFDDALPNSVHTYTPVHSEFTPIDLQIFGSAKGAVAGVPEKAYVVANGQLLIHDPLTNTTFIGEPLLKDRRFYSVVTVKEFVYVCGGYYPKWDVYLTTCEAYDTLANRWSYDTKRMNIGRGHHAAVAIKNKMYLMGGRGPVSRSLIIYDHDDDTWFKGADMLYDAENHAAVAIGAHIFTCGGVDDNLCSGYNIKTNRWYSMATMLIPRTFHEMVLWNGSPLIMGGLINGEPTGAVEYYDWIHNRTVLLHQMLAQPQANFAAMLLL